MFIIIAVAILVGSFAVLVRSAKEEYQYSYPDNEQPYTLGYMYGTEPNRPTPDSLRTDMI
jgi:hypothetical protein